MSGLSPPQVVSRRRAAADDATDGNVSSMAIDDPPGRRDPHFRAPFHRSIRFRLTAWYATAMILVIIALSVSLHTLLVRALTSDVESRLANAAREIAPGIAISPNERLPADSPRTIDDLVQEPPRFDSVLLSGLWFQIFGRDQQPHHVDSAGALTNAPADLVSALGDSDVFSVERSTYKTVTVDDVESLVLVSPLPLRVSETQRIIVGWVVVGEPLGFRNTVIEVVDRVLRLFGIVGVALAVWGGWLIAGRALSPVGRITGAAGSIANSRGAVSLSNRLDVPNTGDELSRLAHTFNIMLNRIETAFNAQRRFVSDASHELRTPLTSVRGNIDVLVRQLNSDRPIARSEIIEELGVVQRESSRMGRLIEDMLVLARSDAPGQGAMLKAQAISLDVLAGAAFRTARQLGKGQKLTLDAGSTVTLHGDGDRLIQVMIILLDNAFRHTPVDGAVELSVDEAVDEGTDVSCARIRVSDTGCGIPAQHVPHLFERFYRAEDSRPRATGGTGLGLSIALAIVRGHAGWIDVDTAPGQGSTFTVWLPLTASAEPLTEEPIQDIDSIETSLQRRLRLFREGMSKGRLLLDPRRTR